MALPFFYIESIEDASSFITLNEETSKHVVQVLRMQAGESINLTDGKGNRLTAVITDAHKKHCVVQVKSVVQEAAAEQKIIIAISLVKNASRFEWFLEKATEMGVSAIVPLLCDRTERQHFRYDRMKGITVSAMLQSQQCWLPELREPVSFDEYLQKVPADAVKLIAHCEETQKRSLSTVEPGSAGEVVLLIGPEGDFSPQEIAAALQQEFIPVTLGETRLRTETAGVAAAALLRIR